MRATLLTLFLAAVSCLGQGQSATFSPTGDLTTKRYLHTATLLNNGDVLITGGYNDNSGYLASAEMYDPGTGTFAPTASMAFAREVHTATLLNNGKVLIAGGHSNTVYIASAELYDSTGGTFSPTGSLIKGRYYHTATLLQNGKVLIVGGYGISNNGYLASAELYDPVTGTFTQTGSLSTARANPQATLLNNGKVLIVGGDNDGSLASAELYDPTTGIFTSTGSLNLSRREFTATLLNNGKVFIAAGYNYTSIAGGYGSVAFNEVYDPSTGAFTSTSNLVVATSYQSASSLINGKVLITGGIGRDTGAPIPDAGIYDSGTGSSTATAHMANARYTHTSTLLNEGKVLIVGGYNGASGYLASAELYTPADFVVLVANAGPDQVVEASSIAGANVTLDGSVASVPIGATLTYTWTGPFGSATGATPVVTMPIGRNTVTLSVDDGHGHSASANTAITVQDTTAPSISGTPANMVLEATNPGGAVASWALPTALDILDGTVAVSCAPASASTFAIGTESVSCVSTDAHGNSSTSTFNVTVRDTKPPTVNCNSPDGLWHANDVSIACTASDAVGLANVADASFTLSTNVASGSENNTAGTGSRNICDGAGNCMTAGPVGGNKIDKKAPSITFNAPASGASYTLNQAVASSYACADDGSGVVSCGGPVATGTNINTGSVEAKSFAVTATDAVGNTSTLDRAYSVLYSVGGSCMGSPSHQVLQPVNADGGSVFKKGSVVPIKFRVCDAGGKSIGTLGVVAAFVQVASVEGTVTEIDEQTYSNTPDTAFRWDADAQQWIFNLDTKNNSTLSAGSTYVFRIYLNDGTFIQYQFGLK